LKEKKAPYISSLAEVKEKVEALAESFDETRKKLDEVGVEKSSGDAETYNRLGIFYSKTKNIEKIPYHPEKP